MDIHTAIAQLRHLYKQMVNGQVKETAQAARGLLGPAIEAIENEQRWRDSYCSACGKHECFGTCPDYEEWERNWLKEMGFTSLLASTFKS